jgi:hypothetical protein
MFVDGKVVAFLPPSLKKKIKSIQKKSISKLYF